MTMTSLVQKNGRGDGLAAGLSSRGALACGVDAPVKMPSLVSLRKLVELKVRLPARVGAALMERLRAGVPGAGVPSEAEDPPVERLRTGTAGVDGAGIAAIAPLAPPTVAGPALSTWAATNDGRIAAKVGAERFDMRRKPLMVTSGDCVASSCRRGSK